MRSSLLGALSVAFAATAAASPVSYTVSATGSGSLNGVSFTDKEITILASGDTSAISGSGSLYTVPVTATVAVAGLGSDSFTESLWAFAYQNGSNSAVGVGLVNWLDILDVQSSAFSSYDLSTAIGPVTGNSLLNPGHSFGTTGGNFVINTAQASTFQAQAVPEPASMAALGLGAVGLLKRRKKA